MCCSAKGFENLAISKKKGDAGHFEIEEGKSCKHKFYMCYAR